jgi:hypothetical protein
MYNISRTTVRHILSHLRVRRADPGGSDYVIPANPIMTMASPAPASLAEQNRLFEQAFSP